MIIMIPEFYMIFFIIVMVIVCIVKVIVNIVKKIINSISRKKFSEHYGVGSLPVSIKIRKNQNQNEKNYFILNFPSWNVSKKDGTADKRIKDNPIIWKQSALFIDNYCVISTKPYDLIEVVKRLRLQGIKIELCDEEKKKCEELLESKNKFILNNDINGIINFYSEKPSDFENLCAKMFERMGYTAKVTPPTNDGGYDILLTKGEDKVIVECKCYSIKNKVGRPIIQKLVGANTVVMANKMIFITTSDFSVEAVSYADEAGVELVNGEALMKLLHEHKFFDREKTKINEADCYLEITDLRRYVPEDIYLEYFQNI